MLYRVPFPTTIRKKKKKCLVRQNNRVTHDDVDARIRYAVQSRTTNACPHPDQVLYNYYEQDMRSVLYNDNSIIRRTTTVRNYDIRQCPLTHGRIRLYMSYVRRIRRPCAAVAVGPMSNNR